MNPVHKDIPNDALRHLSFAVIGGFFGAYAILGRGGIFASAQTMNLLQMTFDTLDGNWWSMFLHFGALIAYILGVSTPIFMEYFFHVDPARLSPIVTGICAIILGFLPAETPQIVALYFIFYPMSCQWTAFSGARNFNSSTIFSTNNTKQMTIGVAKFLCEHDRSQLKRAAFYASTLVAFHCGAIVGFLAVHWLDYHASFAALPIIAVAFYSVIREEHQCEEETEEELEEVKEELSEEIEEIEELKQLEQPAQKA